METLLEIETAAKEAEELARIPFITGAGAKAFVAGADIKEMADKMAVEARQFS